MKLVIDANVAFSSFLKLDSEEVNIIESGMHEVFLCAFTGVELFKNKEKILRYSELHEEQIVNAYQLLVENTKAIPEYEIPAEVYRKAEELCEGVDPSDALYVAAALFLNATLWTGDKKLKEGLAKKGFKNVVSTAELF